MNRFRNVMLLRLCLAAIHCASWMIPAEDRYEWLREWASELCHIGSMLRDAPLQTQWQMAAFARGAFPDAFWLAIHAWRTGKEKQLAFHSPAQCLIVLFLAGVITTTLAFFLPGTHNAVLHPSPYQDARSLVLISHDGYSQSVAPSVRYDEFRNWTLHARHLYSELAFYRVVQRHVRIAHGVTAQLSVARATGNLFYVLRLRSAVSVNDSAPKGVPRLLLSDAVWRTYFHADPHITGRVLFVSGEKIIVAGVVSLNAWQLPGGADAWLMETDERMNTLPDQTTGYVVARMKATSLRNGSKERWHMLVPNGDGGYDGFECISVAKRLREPLYLCAFAWMLALLALPATTPLPLGEYPSHPRQQSWSVRVRRWVFLFAKLLLLLPILCFGPLDLASAISTHAATATSIQLFVTFAATLFALRWTLRDQRRRCPVCLQLLRNPVRVGQPSRNFLAWNGTELICVGGHGFLHVPEIATSWFGAQRWLDLDPSWRTLFRPSWQIPMAIPPAP